MDKFNALEEGKEFIASKEKKVQTVLGKHENGTHFVIKSSTGKIYAWGIEQFMKDVEDGTKVMINGTQFTSSGTSVDVSKWKA